MLLPSYVMAMRISFLENPKQHIYWLNSICVEWSMLYIVESVDDIHDVLTEALVVVAR